MSSNDISRELIQRGEALFAAPPAKQIPFTQDASVNALLNDLKNFPHAFVLGSVMDRQIPAEKAWAIPYRVAALLGDFSIETLNRLHSDEVLQLFLVPEKLHRYPRDMAGFFHDAVKLISSRYGGDAAEIWRHNPSSTTVVKRFREFRGVGQKISTMAANILARDFKIPFSDYASIDVSADVHVLRVFSRLGLTPGADDREAAIQRAKELSPSFPGLLDLPVWEVGRTWCRPEPLCSSCYLSTMCPTALNRRA